MKNKIQEKEGFTLLITIIGLALMTTLGFAILTSTTNNFKATDTDSKNQSAYYIAEAGVNYSIDYINTLMGKISAANSSAFFTSLNNEIELIPKSISFENNFGVKPNANIKITPVINKNTNNETKEFLIESIGTIGQSNRTVSSTISIEWKDSISNPSPYDPNIVINTNNFVYGGGDLEAEGQTIILDANNASKFNGGAEIEAKNIYFKGGDVQLVSKEYGDDDDRGTIYFEGSATSNRGDSKIEGDVYVKGNFTATGGLKVKGDLYVKGNLTLSGTSKVEGNVFVLGTAKIASADIKGNLFVFNQSNDNIALDASWSSKIDGDLYVDGNTNFSGTKIGGISNIKGSLKIDNSSKIGEDTEKITLYHSGDLINKNSIDSSLLNKIKYKKNIDKVEAPLINFVTPGVCKITLKSEEWYKDNGYKKEKNMNVQSIPKEAKHNVDSFTMNSYQEQVQNVIIISMGNIDLKEMKQFKGVLISAEGEIKVQSSGEFEGVLMSSKGINFIGNMDVEVFPLQKYFKTEAEIPVNIDCGQGTLPGSGQGGNGGNSSKSNVVLKTTKKIREK